MTNWEDPWGLRAMRREASRRQAPRMADVFGDVDRLQPVSRGKRAGGLKRGREGKDGGESDIEQAASGEGEREEDWDSMGGVVGYEV